MVWWTTSMLLWIAHDLYAQAHCMCATATSSPKILTHNLQTGNDPKSTGGLHLSGHPIVLPDNLAV